MSYAPGFQKGDPKVAILGFSILKIWSDFLGNASMLLTVLQMVVGILYNLSLSIALMPERDCVVMNCSRSTILWCHTIKRPAQVSFAC